MPVDTAHSKSVGVGAEHYEICPECSGHESAVHAVIRASGAAVIYITISSGLQKFTWLIVAALAVLLPVGIYVTRRHMYRKVEASYLDMD